MDMKNIIFSDREADSNEWMTATVGRKFITLQFRSRYQGRKEYTILYAVSDKDALLKTLNNPMCNIDAITEFGWGPKPVKVTESKNI